MTAFVLSWLWNIYYLVGIWQSHFKDFFHERLMADGKKGIPGTQSIHPEVSTTQVLVDTIFTGLLSVVNKLVVKAHQEVVEGDNQGNPNVNRAFLLWLFYFTVNCQPIRLLEEAVCWWFTVRWLCKRLALCRSDGSTQPWMQLQMENQRVDDKNNFSSNDSQGTTTMTLVHCRIRLHCRG